MANNQYVNKVIYGNQTLIDLSNDTITADKILAGYTAHNASGASITGTCAGVQIPVPSSGTNSFYIQVPNGTTAPDAANDDDWIKVLLTVDTGGNSEITTDSIEVTTLSAVLVSGDDYMLESEV